MKHLAASTSDFKSAMLGAVGDAGECNKILESSYSSH